MKHSSNVSQLEERLQYTFKDKSLLNRALTHRSVRSDNNERLEYLGDALINCVVAAWLYKFPSFCEGQLSRSRAFLASKTQLAMLGHSLKLSDYLEKNIQPHPNVKPTSQGMIADCLEAIFGAIFEDSNFETAQQIFLQAFEQQMTKTLEQALNKDPKTALQEFTQKHFQSLPKYTLVHDKSLGHQREFKVQCWINKHKTFGKGLSLKSAQSQAAQIMMEMLDE